MKKIFISAIAFVLLSVSLFAQNDDYESPKCRTHFNISKYSKNAQILGQVQRPTLAKETYSKSGRFLAHYDLTGVNAVPNIDLDKNGIPDYIDSSLVYFEIVYDYYINKLGLKAPLSDGNAGGSNAYDVYFIDYALSPLPAYGATEGDSATSSKTNNTWVTFMQLDNNYSSADSILDTLGIKRRMFLETGYRCLFLTIAHEYNHAVQASYGWCESSSILEMISTYFENVFVPDSKDFTQYVNRLMAAPQEYPFSNLDYPIGYRYCIFIKYIVDRFGEGIIKDIFEAIAADLSPLEAFNAAFEKHGSDLSSVWNDFVPSLYFTGSRAGEKLIFPYADKVKEIALYDNVKNKPFPVNFSGALDPFEFRASRIIINADSTNFSGDTLFYIYTNSYYMGALSTNTQGAKYNLKTENESFNFSKYTGVKSFNYSFDLESIPSFDTCIVGAGFPINFISYAYPNPINKEYDSFLNIPAPRNYNLSQKAQVLIYTSDSREIVNVELPIKFHEQHQVVQIPIKNYDLPNGVYIYKAKFEENEQIGKFAVIRKN